MADEEKEEGAAEGKEGKKGGNKLIIFIVAGVLVLLLVIGIVVAILMMGGDEDVADPNAPSGDQAVLQEKQQQAKKVANSDMLTIGPMYPLDQFIVNLLTQSGRRYLKATVNLELSDESLMAELETKEAVVTDTVINILSSKSLEEISTIKGKEKLKQEIQERINEYLVDGQIKGVYFTQFVIQ